MVAADQRLVGRCAVEESHARLCRQWHIQVEPERPFRMQETDRPSISSLPELMCTEMWHGV
jgi:hypothetical protein